MERLGIAWGVRFTGMLAGEELVSVLQELDIVINPSLRAWSETFCIANIEVMAMGIPLVTFGVGGVGEYIERIEVENNATPGYELARNMILLHDASPVVVANDY